MTDLYEKEQAGARKQLARELLDAMVEAILAKKDPVFVVMEALNKELSK